MEENSFQASKKLEFNKTNLFFRSEPFKISYDSIKVKNTGTTCIYFKWQKVYKPFNLQEKKSDGIEKFFCHYSDSKLFPGEEKEFTFSFFSEKNGIFSEYWELKTEPELKDVDLSIHLNGMTLVLVDKFSNEILKLDKSISKKSEGSLVHELVLDLIYNVKTPPPRRPNLNDPNHFKFYFTHYNKEYNVYFSDFIMKQALHLENLVFEAIQSENSDFGEEDRYWNGSIDELKKTINTHIHDPEIKRELLFKVEVFVHRAQRKIPETSKVINTIKGILNDFPVEIVELANKIKEELVMPPTNFDYLTRQNLTEQENTKYNNDLNKKKDDFLKKNKKKYKNNDEENAEYNEYKNRLNSTIKIVLSSKFSELEKIEFLRSIEEKTLNSNFLTEDYVDRLSRIKNFNHIKEILESKIVIVRVDLEPFDPVYEEVKNEEGIVIDKVFKHIDFARAKDVVLPISVNQFIDNRAKLVILIASYGPRAGVYNEKYSMDHFIKYLQRETTVDQQIILIKNEDLLNLTTKIENEEYKDGSILVLENLNFNPEECEFEIDENGNQQFLNYYNKIKFTKMLSAGYIFVNDSHTSISQNYPSISSMQCEQKIVGNNIFLQLQKLITFFSVATKDFCMVIGNDNEDIYHSLLTLNACLNYFKKIFIFGKLALHFICFVQEDYYFGDTIKLNPDYFQLMKFILVRASLNNIEIVLPEDIFLLHSSEYEKFSTVENYMKYIKTLKKRDKIAKDLYAIYAGTDELDQQEDYMKNVLNEEEAKTLEFYQVESIELKSLNDHLKSFVENQDIKYPVKKLNYDYEFADFLESIYKKPLVRQKENEEKINMIKDEYVLVDFGLKSYSNFAEYISKHENNVKCLLWIDNLSPSNIENLFDNYNHIMSELYTRKNYLKERFKDMIADEEVKPSENDLKSRKNLLNILLKGKNVYNCLKNGYKMILNENKQGEEEDNQDDDALNLEIRNFVDFFLEEELEVILNILKGENIYGLYNLDTEEKKPKVEEIDLKFLEEI